MDFELDDVATLRRELALVKRELERVNEQTLQISKENRLLKRKISDISTCSSSTTELDDPQPSTSTFLVGEKIAAGSFPVYRGWFGNRQAAFKEIKFDERHRARNEANILLSLEHKYIVEHLSVTKGLKHGDERVIMIVTELQPRGNLQTLINDANVAYTIGRLWEWCKQILKALLYLQQQKILHRDIKAENVFLAGNYDVKIGDFGVAVSASEPQMKTETTLRYQAPESIWTDDDDGNARFLYKSDLYSAALLFWEMAERRVVFERKEKEIVNMLVAQHKLRLPKAHCYVPLRDIIDACSELDARKRPTTRKTLRFFIKWQKDPDFHRNKKTTIFHKTSTSKDDVYIIDVEDSEEVNLESQLVLQQQTDDFSMEIGAPSLFFIIESHEIQYNEMFTVLYHDRLTDTWIVNYGNLRKILDKVRCVKLWIDPDNRHLCETTMDSSVLQSSKIGMWSEPMNGTFNGDVMSLIFMTVQYAPTLDQAIWMRRFIESVCMLSLVGYKEKISKISNGNRKLSNEEIQEFVKDNLIDSFELAEIDNRLNEQFKPSLLSSESLWYGFTQCILRSECVIAELQGLFPGVETQIRTANAKASKIGNDELNNIGLRYLLPFDTDERVKLGMRIGSILLETEEKGLLEMMKYLIDDVQELFLIQYFEFGGCPECEKETDYEEQVSFGMALGPITEDVDKLGMIEVRDFSLSDPFETLMVESTECECGDKKQIEFTLLSDMILINVNESIELIGDLKQMIKNVQGTLYHFVSAIEVIERDEREIFIAWIFDRDHWMVIDGDDIRTEKEMTFQNRTFRYFFLKKDKG